MVSRTLLIAAFASANLFSGTVTLNAVATGWYDQTGFHDATNPNYFSGGLAGGLELRDYFVFDLPSVTGQIVGATLQAFNPQSVTDKGTETYELLDVTTSIATL